MKRQELRNFIKEVVKHVLIEKGQMMLNTFRWY